MVLAIDLIRISFPTVDNNTCFFNGSNFLLRFPPMTKDLPIYVAPNFISLNSFISLILLFTSLLVFLEKWMLNFSKFVSRPNQLSKYSLTFISSLALTLYIVDRSSTYMKWEIDGTLLATLIPWILPSPSFFNNSLERNLALNIYKQVRGKRVFLMETTTCFNIFYHITIEK